MKLTIIFTAIIFGFATMTFAQKVELVIGSAGNTGTDGIYIYEFNVLSGEASFKRRLEVNRPSYMALSKDKKFIYAITEGGNISAYAYKGPDEAPGLINKQTSGAKGPIHISVDKNSRYVFASNYDGGSLTVLPVRNDGSLGPVTQSLVQEGQSIDSLRQTKPYVHSAVLSPDSKFLFSSDLGTDKLNIYRVSKGKVDKPLSLSDQQFIQMQPGSGPRFFTFHPSMKVAYVIQELQGMFTAFRYNGRNLLPIQSISMLDENFRGKSGAADLHVSPDGKYLYGSNRGDANEIVFFSIDPKSGVLTYAGRYASSLKRPRYFAIDPTGNFLLLTNQGSDNITILKRDKATGVLSATGQTIQIAKPVCLVFLE